MTGGRPAPGQGPAGRLEPTSHQISAARAVVIWYIGLYHGSPDDPGVAPMFTDPARVGHFAVELAALNSGDPASYFRLLVATTMFQRRQDLQIQRVLRGMSRRDADELADAGALLTAARACSCPRAQTLPALLADCDLGKTPEGKGMCHSAPSTACALKRHTELLKRYGHFGKVPTSLALAIESTGASSLPELRETIVSSSASPREAAARLEAALTVSWRVSDKIAAMYLSMLANPDLSPGFAPWENGVDWAGWVVIDSNVDLFLRAIGYRGSMTYAARRGFVEDLAAGIDLAAISPALHRYNPRIIQQAAYLFMSVTNRRAAARDCSHLGAAACSTCPPVMSDLCPRRHASSSPPGIADNAQPARLAAGTPS